jgi:hypothetical protein
MHRYSAVLLLSGSALLVAPAFAQIDMSQDPPVLQRRPDNSNPAYSPNQPAPYGSSSTYNNPYQIPEGSSVIVRLDDTLDTNKLHNGKKFTAKLAEDLVTPSGMRIPRGKKVHGHVSDAANGFSGHMLLTFNEIETNHGWIPLMATVAGVPGEKGVHTQGNEGEIQKNGVDKRRAVESAIAGAAIGATAGAIGGGGRGAGIGAGAGAALGTTAGILTSRNLRLEKGTQIELRLDRPLAVPAS